MNCKQPLKYLRMLVLPVWTSCVPQHSSTTAVVKGDESDEIETYPMPEACPETQTYFSYDLHGKVAASEKDIKIKGTELEVRQQTENDYQGFRLDLCVDTATLTTYLQRVVQRRSRMSAFMTAYREYKPLDDKADPNLSTAMAEGASKDLEIRLRNTHRSDEGLLVKGWVNSEGKPFITISQYRIPSANVLQASSSPVVFGTLQEGDPWITTFQNHDRIIETDHLKIELSYDVKPGANNYKEYRAHKVHIKDDNPKLAKKVDRTIEEPDLEKALKIVETHHSLLDRFEITLPEGLYVIGGGGVKIQYAPATGLGTLDTGIKCSEVSKCGESPVMEPPRF